MLVHSLNVLSSTVAGSKVELTVHEALSGISAWISVCAWIFFLIPQLLENRRNQSGEAVSLAFILIRFAGDVFNLLGALLGNIIAEMVAVAADYCISDVLLLAQVLYYGIRNRRGEGKGWFAAVVEAFKGDLTRKNGKPVRDDSAEDAPLLQQRTHAVNSHETGLQKAYHALETPLDNLTDALDEQGPQSSTRIWLKDLGIVIGVCIVAVAGWALAYKFGLWKPKPEDSNASNDGTEGGKAKAGEVLGYVSAALSLCSRIPQIYKNWRNKSCEGLSLLFFILSLVGNLTSGTSILFHSTQRAYLIKNTPWLLGTLGTIAQDGIIFLQFHWYKKSAT